MCADTHISRMYARIYAYARAYMLMGAHICIYAHIYAYMRACTHICAHICIYACKYAYLRAYMRRCTLIQICVHFFWVQMNGHTKSELKQTGFSMHKHVRQITNSERRQPIQASLAALGLQPAAAIALLGVCLR